MPQDAILGELDHNMNAIGDHPRPTPFFSETTDYLYTNQIARLIWTALMPNRPFGQNSKSQVNPK